MSQSSHKGRRTPLTLGNNKHANGRKNHGDSGVLADRPTSGNEPVSVEQLKQKVQPAEVANNQNGKPSAKNGNNGTSVEKNVAAVAPNQKEMQKGDGKRVDIGRKDEPVKGSKKEEVAKKDEQKKELPKQEDTKKEVAKKDDKPTKNVVEESEKTNGASVKATVVSSKNGDKPDIVRESPRQKEMRETREKDEKEQNKLQEQREIEEALAAFKAQEEKEKLIAPAVIFTPATPEVNQAETPAKTRSSIDGTPVKGSPGTSTPKRNTTISDPSISLLQQSDLHGFADDCDDMEELRMENDGFGDSPMPKSAKNHSKILKFSNSPSVNRARVSPFRRSIETNASTAANLSTVSEQSTEAANSPAVPIGAARVAGDECYGSLRHITGRKSTRPLRELTLQHTMRESYRRIKTDLDDSISSMNATVGSEIPNESFSTPMVAVKGRKRVAIGGSEPDLSSALESPKKARLDLSGFFTVMASPVTLLRNKFSRASLLSSTPNKKKLIIDAVEPEPKEEEKPDEGDLNVSGIEDVQMVEVDLGKTDVSVDVASDSVKQDAGLDVIPDTAGEIVIETEQLKSVDDIKDKIDEEEASEEGVVIITEHKKSRCAIM